MSFSHVHRLAPQHSTMPDVVNLVLSARHNPIDTQPLFSDQALLSSLRRIPVPRGSEKQQQFLKAFSTVEAARALHTDVVAPRMIELLTDARGGREAIAFSQTFNSEQAIVDLGCVIAEKSFPMLGAREQEALSKLAAYTTQDRTPGRSGRETVRQLEAAGHLPEMLNNTTVTAWSDALARAHLGDRLPEPEHASQTPTTAHPTQEVWVDPQHLHRLEVTARRGAEVRRLSVLEAAERRHQELEEKRRTLQKPDMRPPSPFRRNTDHVR